MGGVSGVVDLLLSGGGEPGQLLAFFRHFGEEVDAAFADAARLVKVTSADRPGVQARGSVRRWLLDHAFRAAADRAGFPVNTGSTVPASWNFPLLRSGAFTLTLGVVDRQKFGFRLRSQGAYMLRLAQRNGSLNPQRSLFEKADTKVRKVTPSGAFGGVMVVEQSPKHPDSPLHVGFFVPSPNLKASYFNVRLDLLISELQKRAAPRKSVRRNPERKKPVVRRRPKEQ